MVERVKVKIAYPSDAETDRRTQAAEASEKWAGQTNSQFSETSGANHNFEDGKKNVLYTRVAEWLACWTEAQKGPGCSNRSRDAVG